MRSFQNLLLVLCSALSCSTCAAGVIQVFGYEGRGVKISCPYDQGYEDYDKYFCEGSEWSSCDVLIKVSQKNNKYFIHDDKKLRMLTVIISNIRLDDAGTYWCGVERTVFDLYTEVRLAVIKDSCCDKVTKIQGEDEGSVSIICPYMSKYQNNLKYICRGHQPSTCLQQALITSNTRHDGRFTLNDDKKSETFTVTILNLTLEDSGSYLCGVQRETGLDVFSAAELEVKEWCCVKSKNIKGSLGHPVTLQCSYPPEHRNNRKFICKGERRSSCEDMTMDQSRFTLHIISSSFFSVTITKLEAGDAGMYWCRSEPEWPVGDYTRFHLAVDKSSTEWCCVKLKNIEGTLGHPVTLQCSYPPEHRNNRKFICKGERRSSCEDMTMDQSRFTLHIISSSFFSVTITKLEAGDAGTYWCRSEPEWPVGDYTQFHLAVDKSSTVSDEALYAVSAAALLTLIIILVTVCRHKLCKKKEPFGNNIEVVYSDKGMDAEDIYENHSAIVIQSRQQTSKQQRAGSDVEEADYENITSEGVYCNEPFHKTHRVKY